MSDELEAKDVGDTEEAFEKNMGELVDKGLMRKTGHGTYAITDAGAQAVDDMCSDRHHAVLLEQRRGLIAAVKATLMFHRGGPWSHAEREAWLELTGHEEATTKNLCDFLRQKLEAAE